MTEPRRHITWDFTVNIPTLLAILALLTGCVTWGVSTYAEIEKRIDAEHSERISLRRDVDRLDMDTKSIRAAIDGKLDALRMEMRGDLRDVNGKLDQILLRTGGRP